MKKIIFLFITIFSLNSFAYNMPYFKVGIGASSLKNYSDTTGTIDFKESYILPLSLTYGVENGFFGTEGQFEIGQSDFDFGSFNGDLSTINLLFRGYTKSHIEGSHFYAGLGIGFVSANLDGIDYDFDGSSILIQPFFGIDLTLDSVRSIFLEYNYSKGLDLDMESPTASIEIPYERHAVSLGMKFLF